MRHKPNAYMTIKTRNGGTRLIKKVKGAKLSKWRYHQDGFADTYGATSPPQDDTDELPPALGETEDFMGD